MTKEQLEKGNKLNLEIKSTEVLRNQFILCAENKLRKLKEEFENL